jgi:hypothetical protein
VNQKLALEGGPMEGRRYVRQGLQQAVEEFMMTMDFH